MPRPTLPRAHVYHRDPDIMGGAPVVRGTRVPVQTLLDDLEGGETIDSFLEGVPGVSRARPPQKEERAEGEAAADPEPASWGQSSSQPSSSQPSSS
jgi:hypothetical protein